MTVPTGRKAVRNDPSALADPLVGMAYGKLFWSRDVTVTGPRNGAQAVVHLPGIGIDLRNSMTSQSAIGVYDLQPGSYVFLGFFDVDNNAGPPGEETPDVGDPVTLSNSNIFQIIDGHESKHVVLFDLIYN